MSTMAGVSVIAIRVFCAISLAALGSLASAQTSVYRCGPQGNEYSAVPCPGGKAIDASDPRSGEQQRQARGAAQREAALADKLAAERKQREAAVKAGAARLGAAASAPQKSASAPETKRRPPKKKNKPAADSRLTPPMRSASQPG